MRTPGSFASTEAGTCRAATRSPRADRWAGRSRRRPSPTAASPRTPPGARSPTPGSPRARAAPPISSSATTPRAAANAPRAGRCSTSCPTAASPRRGTARRPTPRRGARSVGPSLGSACTDAGPLVRLRRLLRRGRHERGLHERRVGHRPVRLPGVDAKRAALSSAGMRRIWPTVSASSMAANTGRRASSGPSPPKAPLGASARALRAVEHEEHVVELLPRGVDDVRDARRGRARAPRCRGG